MKLAFSKPTGTDVEEQTLFTHFREVGFDGLQLKAGQYARHVDDPEGFLDLWGERPGAASALITGMRVDDEGAAAIRRLVRFGQAIGTELIVICLAGPREGLTLDDIRALATSLSALGREALESGVKLSLHNHLNSPLMHAEDLEAFYEVADVSAVGLTLDTAHAALSGIEDIAGVIRNCRHALDNFHLKDLRDGKFEVLGRGQLDFTPIFAAIRETGYDGWISADEESGADLVEGMRECYRFIAEGTAGR